MLSYSAIRGRKGVTLPTVDSWGNDGVKSIVKDPPKSVHTRKIDKVGDTNAVKDAIDCGSDRACEAIRVYPRGVNPMVAVNYNSTSGGVQSKLPRTLNAFRPPIMTQEQLQPLSRQNRLRTRVHTNPEVVNYTKRAFYKHDHSKAIKEKMINLNIEPRRIQNIETPVKQHQTENHINAILKVDARNSGIKIIKGCSANQGSSNVSGSILRNPLRRDPVSANPTGASVSRNPVLSKMAAGRVKEATLSKEVSSGLILPSTTKLLSTKTNGNIVSKINAKNVQSGKVGQTKTLSHKVATDFAVKDALNVRDVSSGTYANREPVSFRTSDGRRATTRILETPLNAKNVSSGLSMSNYANGKVRENMQPERELNESPIRPIDVWTNKTHRGDGNNVVANPVLGSVSTRRRTGPVHYNVNTSGAGQLRSYNDVVEATKVLPPTLNIGGITVAGNKQQFDLQRPPVKLKPSLKLNMAAAGRGI